MEEEGDIYDGARAQFPLSFGKQSKPITRLESIHSSTRRDNPSRPLPPPPSSSRAAWLEDALPAAHRRPSLSPSPSPAAPKDAIFGTVGGGDGPGLDEAEKDDGVLIGPPPPPPGAVESDSEKEGEDDDDSMGGFDTPFRIPISNEIVLKGHTKVTLFFFFFVSLFCIFCSLILLKAETLCLNLSWAIEKTSKFSV